MQQAFALVDCNNFYVSCERVFQPKLEGVPVLVLSNNDGCAIARSNEVKKLGVKMGTPFFQIRQLMQEHNVKVFSSNYTLYGDMSRRVHNILADLAPSAEIYSIDESFLELGGIANLQAHAQLIRSRVKQWTGIPVSVGIGPTKVLAKIANHIAKKQPEHNGVFIMPDNPDEVLGRFMVPDIWGVGPAYAKKLLQQGIKSALDLKRASDAFIRQQMTVVGLRIVHELRGLSCLSLEEIEPKRKSICCSRSFGHPVTDKRELEEAVCSYVARAGQKLRRRGLAASYISVFIRTNQFNADAKYFPHAGLPVAPASAYTPGLNHLAQHLLRAIYKPGYRYWKAGILLDGLLDADDVPGDLFNNGDTPRKQALMKALDALNLRYGRGTVQSAGEGIRQHWKMQRNLLTPRYTTNWDELLTVTA